MVVSDFSSDLDLLPCDSITSCSCMCLLCQILKLWQQMPWSVFVRSTCLTPSLLQLFDHSGQEVNQLSELYHSSCSLPWQLPSFGLKTSFKKAIGSSSYSSVTTSSRVLLLFSMEFLSSSFLAEVSFQKDFHRRGPGEYLSSITVYEAMWNCFKNL